MADRADRGEHEAGHLLLSLALCVSLAAVSCGHEVRDADRGQVSSDGWARLNEDGVLVDISPAALRSSRASGVDLVAASRQALGRITSLIPELRTQVVEDVDPDGTIPGLGVGGHTDPNTGDVSISLRADASAGNVETWLPDTLAQELDHAARVTVGPGFGSTLLEVMITEAMADAFATQAFPRTPDQPWAKALSPGQMRGMWAKARTRLGDLIDLSDYGRWFLGEGRLPGWTGYSIGSAIVSSYLASHPTEVATDLVPLSADEVFRGSGWSTHGPPPIG